ncbi:MAG: putative acetyltransferase, superfamily [Pseudonocardiales bacterium]|jgi:hypothetical protein|nr:putative acetyltransferase, superfamily [Pseudonocardiales bacterium]
MTINLEAEAATREENNAALIAALNEASLSEVESSWELDVINDAERGRWIAALGAEAIAELPYRFVGGRVVLLTTLGRPRLPTQSGGHGARRSRAGRDPREREEDHRHLPGRG